MNPDPVSRMSRCVPPHTFLHTWAPAYLLQDNDAADATKAPLPALLAQICVTSSELEQVAEK